MCAFWLFFGSLFVWWTPFTVSIQKAARNDLDQVVEATEVAEIAGSFDPPFFFSHIPKTGGTSFAGIIQRDVVEAGLPSSAICNHLKDPVTQWSTWTSPGSSCLVHVTERPHFSAAVGTFTLIREPKHHVLSQYFHCTECPAHKKAHLMPSLDRWLEVWTVARPNASVRRVRKHFGCYDPVNLQSTYLGFPEDETAMFSRFLVVGLTSEMERSTCLASIRVLGGVVPQRCNCTHRVSPPSRSRGVDHQSAPTDALTKDQRLFGYFQWARKDVVDHGVQHHGASYNTTPDQAILIDALTKEDQRVFQWARKHFARQIIEVEERYGFRLC